VGGSVSIVQRFDSPKIQLKLKLALTLTLTLTDIGGGVLTLTDTGDLWTIEPSDYRTLRLSSRHRMGTLGVACGITFVTQSCVVTTAALPKVLW